MPHGNYRTPGVYREEIYPSAPVEFRTGVPAFLGFTHAGEDKINRPLPLALWPQFEDHFGKPLSCGFVGHAVRGFFENGGSLCYVVALDDPQNPAEALRRGLEVLESLDTIDLVCAPDIMIKQSPIIILQQQLLAHCEKSGERFAILDSMPGLTVDEVLAQRQQLRGNNGALYYPWIDTGEKDMDGNIRYVPACGHIAGIYARSDTRIGVHKAPANEVLEGVVDLEVRVSDIEQNRLNPKGINCLRALPGRGIRVWGARTLSDSQAWIYINVRRLFLTAGRWIDRNMSQDVFEPNDPNLWARIIRDLGVYFNDLFMKGALKGATAEEAFYVKCDEETNPAEVRDAGQVIAEIGLAPTRPNEFIIIRIIHGANGITLAGPSRPIS